MSEIVPTKYRYRPVPMPSPSPIPGSSAGAIDFPRLCPGLLCHRLERESARCCSPCLQEAQGRR